MKDTSATSYIRSYTFLYKKLMKFVLSFLLSLPGSTELKKYKLKIQKYIPYIISLSISYFEHMQIKVIV